MKLNHRDWPKRIHIPDTSYFITFYTKHRYPFFKESVLCDVFLKNLRICKKMKDFLLFGWVILYEHIHLLLMPSEKSNISDVMHCLKRHTSRDINIMLGYTSSHTAQGGDSDPHLQIKDMPQFQWQQSFYDRYMRNDLEFNNALDYIAYNPEKHGLPDDWLYVYTNPKYNDLTDEIL